MSAIWLQKTDLGRLAGAGLVIDTTLSISELPRAAAAVLRNDETVQLRMNLQEADHGITLLDAGIQTTLKLTCQRCLDEMPVRIDSELRLALLSKKTQEGLIPVGYEPLLIPGGEIRVADLIEDEILLGLPISPRHDDKDCGPLREDLQTLQESAADTDTTTPFAGLADMMRDTR